LIETAPPDETRSNAGRRGRTSLLIALLAASCAGAPASVPSDDSTPPTETAPTIREKLLRDGWRIADGAEGAFDVAWRSLAGDLPRNRDFDMEARVLQDETVVVGAQVRVRGWMPAHGHGLVRSPPVTEVEPGLHRVSGMLLHMRGHWKVFFDVIHDGVGDIAAFEVEL